MGGCTTIISTAPISTKFLEGLSPRVSVCHADPKVREIRRIKKLSAIKANTAKEMEEAGFSSTLHTLMDLDRNVIKTKVMTRQEARERNQSIKDLGYAWCKGGE